MDAVLLKKDTSSSLIHRRPQYKSCYFTVLLNSETGLKHPKKALFHFEKHSYRQWPYLLAGIRAEESLRCEEPEGPVIKEYFDTESMFLDN